MSLRRLVGVSALLIVGCASIPNTEAPSTSTPEVTPAQDTPAQIAPDPAEFLPQEYLGSVSEVAPNRYLVIGMPEFGEGDKLIIMVENQKEVARLTNPEWLLPLTEDCDQSWDIASKRVDEFTLIDVTCTSGEDCLFADFNALIFDLSESPSLQTMTPIWSGRYRYQESNQVTGCQNGDGGRIVFEDNHAFIQTNPWTDSMPDQDGEEPVDCAEIEAPTRKSIF